jgi:hypothetical protein
LLIRNDLQELIRCRNKSWFRLDLLRNWPTGSGPVIGITDPDSR